MTWLIVCRAIQGVGGGAIYQLVQIVIADIVPLQECVYIFLLSNSSLCLTFVHNEVAANMVATSELRGA